MRASGTRSVPEALVKFAWLHLLRQIFERLRAPVCILPIPLLQSDSVSYPRFEEPRSPIPN